MKVEESEAKHESFARTDRGFYW